MPKLEVITDGTVSGFQVILDGEDITKSTNVVSFGLNAYASEEYVSYSYTTSESYTNEAGEQQGNIRKSFTYSNGKWENTEEVRALGQPVVDFVGGKQIKDITIQDKLTRLSKIK